MNPLLEEAARRAARYTEAIRSRRVAPLEDGLASLDALGGPLPGEACNAAEILRLLDDAGSPATVANTGGRYFGFVVGGSLPAALAAHWLAAAWDQNAARFVMSPVAARLEEIVEAWLREIFNLPASAGAGFVTGGTMANFACLAAARHALLERAGWDVEERGLFGAPEIRVVVGQEVHVSMRKALGLLGLGRARVLTAPVDAQGRIDPARLPPLNDRTLIAIQAGNVNSGAFDPAREICRLARGDGAWVHVDGAFGLWAAAAPARRHLLDGVEDADSWAVDCHKWLNVPQDSGLAFVRRSGDLRAAMAVHAAYLQTSGEREPSHFTPEASRRARGVEIWAALRSLGRNGLEDMIERHCRLAARFAEQLRGHGLRILNDVVLNQVLVSFGGSDITRRVVAAVQTEGTCWCGGTEWQGQAAMRISVSSWATTEQDVDASVAAIVRCWEQARSAV